MGTQNFGILNVELIEFQLNLPIRQQVAIFGNILRRIVLPSTSEKNPDIEKLDKFSEYYLDTYKDTLEKLNTNVLTISSASIPALIAVLGKIKLPSNDCKMALVNAAYTSLGTIVMFIITMIFNIILANYYVKNIEKQKKGKEYKEERKLIVDIYKIPIITTALMYILFFFTLFNVLMAIMEF